MNLSLEPKPKVPWNRVCPAPSHMAVCEENEMKKQNKDFNQQSQQSKPPLVDEVAKQRQKAEEQEVAGRHKNDGQNDHKGNKP
jgi:hypothetical protein